MCGCVLANRESVFQFPVSAKMDCCQVGGQSFMVAIGKLSLLLQFKTPTGLYSVVLLLFDVGSREFLKTSLTR